MVTHVPTGIAGLLPLVEKAEGAPLAAMHVPCDRLTVTRICYDSGFGTTGIQECTLNNDTST